MGPSPPLTLDLLTSAHPVSPSLPRTSGGSECGQTMVWSNECGQTSVVIKRWWSANGCQTLVVKRQWSNDGRNSTSGGSEWPREIISISDRYECLPAEGGERKRVRWTGDGGTE